jgi:hypothetical protein
MASHFLSLLRESFLNILILAIRYARFTLTLINRIELICVTVYVANVCNLHMKDEYARISKLNAFMTSMSKASYFFLNKFEFKYFSENRIIPFVKDIIKECLVNSVNKSKLVFVIKNKSLEIEKNF